MDRRKNKRTDGHEEALGALRDSAQAPRASRRIKTSRFMTLPIFRSKRVTPEYAVQQPGLANLRRYSGTFAKSREVPVTLVMSTRLSECIIAASIGPDFHETDYENLLRNPNLVKIGHFR